MTACGKKAVARGQLQGGVIASATMLHKRLVTLAYASVHPKANEMIASVHGQSVSLKNTLNADLIFLAAGPLAIAFLRRPSCRRPSFQIVISNSSACKSSPALRAA
jgi:hypothetical protein